MVRLSVLIVLAALGLVGCATHSANPQLVGTYFGTNSEFLEFSPDNFVYFSHVVEGRAQRELLGYASAVSSSPPDSYFIIGPDTSSFLGTSFQASDDFLTITVHWENVRDPKVTVRQTVFSKKDR